MPESIPVVTALTYVGRPVNESARSAWIRCPATATRVHALMVTRPAVAGNPDFQASVKVLASRDGGQTFTQLSDSGKGTGFVGAQPPQDMEGNIGVTNPDVRELWQLAYIPDRVNPLNEPVPEWGDGVRSGPSIQDASNLWLSVEATCHGGFAGEWFGSVILFAEDNTGEFIAFDPSTWKS